MSVNWVTSKHFFHCARSRRSHVEQKVSHGFLINYPVLNLYLIWWCGRCWIGEWALSSRFCVFLSLWRERFVIVVIIIIIIFSIVKLLLTKLLKLLLNVEQLYKAWRSTTYTVFFTFLHLILSPNPLVPLFCFRFTLKDGKMMRSYVVQLMFNDKFLKQLGLFTTIFRL